MSHRTSRPDLVDLRSLTEQWRVRRDEEGLPVIPGRRGHVSAQDLETLCVHLRGARLVRKALRQLPAGWKRHQTGDDEANVLAPIGDLDAACRLVRAYRRRRLSEAQKARLAAVSRPFSRREPVAGERFTPEISAPSAGEGEGMGGGGSEGPTMPLPQARVLSPILRAGLERLRAQQLVGAFP